MRRKSGWSLWRFALLAASILSSFFLLTECQGTVPKILVEPKKQEVTLTPNRRDAEKAESCRWYRGLTTDEDKRIFTYYLSPPPPVQNNGPAFTGRESGGPGCSLQIKNLTSEDTGNYTVVLDGREMITAIVSPFEVVRNPKRARKGP